MNIGQHVEANLKLYAAGFFFVGSLIGLWLSYWQQ